MAQTLLLSSPSLPCFSPPSPDPTPLRMLAFSVAEAALQSDLNSPMFRESCRVPIQDEIQEWNEPTKSRLSRWSIEPKQTIATRRGQPLWAVVERAKERRERERSSPSTIDSPLPTSPDDYNFTLPSNSYLAADVASESALSPTKQFGFPLYTRSAEPSPTKSTFSGLDQTRPPPEFKPKPRLSAQEFAATVDAMPSPSQRLQAQAISRLNWPSASRHTAKAKLPSLAEIQRKINTATAGNGLRRSDSTSSDEVLQTPEDEIKEPNMSIRCSTPPSESRLAPFLRQRTSGRLVAGARPKTMPPISVGQDPVSYYAERPTLTVTPPSATPSVPPPSARRQVFTPTRSRTFPSATSPTSPTDSGRSSSPTLSIPIITCTPAQQDDSESDSDSESDAVVVFDKEQDNAREMEERSRRGQEMRDRLLARRRSLQ